MKSKNMRQSKTKGIYILTNTVNKKQYVGMDSNIPRRFKQHIKGIGGKCPLLHDALSAFGLDKWTVQFIPYPSISNTALRAVEQWYIGKLQTKHPDGYNMRDGSNPIRKQKQAKYLTPAAKRRAELKAQVQKRREQGVLLETIADEFDISKGTVSEWCKGIKPAKETVQGKAAKKRVEKEACIQKARTRKKEGATLEDIKAEFNIALSTAHRWCQDVESE